MDYYVITVTGERNKIDLNSITHILTCKKNKFNQQIRIKKDVFFQTVFFPKLDGAKQFSRAN